MKKSLAGLLLLILSVSISTSYAGENWRFPFISKFRANAERTRAVGHAKQISIAIVEFQMEYGAKPGEKMVKEIEGAKAETANDCFRQFLQGLHDVRTEQIFYAATSFSKKPDQDIGESPNFKQACAKGEVGFVYVDAPDAKDGAPLALAPLLDAKSGKFDYFKYRGKAVVLSNEGVVTTYPIDKKTGKIMIKARGEMVDILSKDNPAFRTPPKIKYPEPR